MSNSSIWTIDMILPGANTPGLSRLGNYGNEGVFHILQSSSITGVLHTNGLISYSRHSLVRALYTWLEFKLNCNNVTVYHIMLRELPLFNETQGQIMLKFKEYTY